MTVLRLDDRDLALGLHWQFHDSREEQRAELHRLGAKAYALVDTEEGVLVGWHRDPGPTPSGLCAGALVVARALPDALVFEALSEGEVWVCAIREGLPLPGTDRVLDPLEAEVQLEQLAAFQSHRVIVGSHPRAQQPLARALAALPAAEWKQARLRKAGGKRRPLLAALAAAACGAALLATQSQASRELPAGVSLLPAPALVAVERAPVPTTAGPSTEEVAAARQRAVEDWRRQRAEMSRTAQQWLAILERLPTSHWGYRPTAVRCEVDACTVDWVWSGGGFFARALEGLPGQRVPGGGATAARDRVQTRFALEAAPRAEPLPWVRDAEGFGLGLVERLSLPGLQLTIQERPPVSVSFEAGGQRFEERLGRLQAVQVSAASLVAAETALRHLEASPLYPERASFTITRGSVSLLVEASYVLDAS